MKTTSSFLEDNLFGRLRSRIIRISICTGKAIPVLNPLEDNFISTIPYLDVAYFVARAPLTLGTGQDVCEDFMTKCPLYH